MGLSKSSTGFSLHRNSVEQDLPTVVLVGNPNVGKSTIFNYFTGMHQHTGNWTGKTVSGATGYVKQNRKIIQLIDTPGAYSLLSRSPDEIITRDTLAFQQSDLVVIICDATTPERGITFALQIMELCPRVILCMNLNDQALKKGIHIHTQDLSAQLGIPLFLTSSKDKNSLKQLKSFIFSDPHPTPICPHYTAVIENELSLLTKQVDQINQSNIPSRFLAIKLLEQDTDFISTFEDNTKISLSNVDLKNSFRLLAMHGYSKEDLQKVFTRQKQQYAQNLCRKTVTFQHRKNRHTLDRFVTKKYAGLLIFSLLLLTVFWITIYGAQYPSQLLQQFLFSLEGPITSFLTLCHIPVTMINMLVDGVYRVVAFVVSVMLPPMAIFFPFFTILEDFGLLPRIAFNLDHSFCRCNACGKQALTMCMGFGCNAAGVIGCRIIQSPRERFLAILTNSLVPCNGRFPTIIALLTLFCSISLGGIIGSFWTAIELTAIIFLCVCITLGCSYLLSKTVLKGNPSFYTLELPSFRVPKIGQVIVRSVFDRTLFVLGRSLLVAAPAGLVLWLLANIPLKDTSLLSQLAYYLNEVGQWFGLDGTILLAFLLGIPANEIIIPIMLMVYTGGTALTEYESLAHLKDILITNGWTLQTALCVLFLMLFHSPCSTTLITIYKETKNKVYTLLAFLIPTIIGILGCLGIHLLFQLF